MNLYDQPPVQMSSEEELRRLTRQQNVTKFMEIYSEELLYHVRNSPDSYAFGPDKVAEVCNRMKLAFMAGSYNHDGIAIKSACKKLGIKHTKKGMEAFFTGTKG